MAVKHGIIGHSRDLETTDMSAYRNKVAETYKAGTFRFGFLDNISLVGTVAEEAGGYIPDVLDMLEESPFLRLVSAKKLKNCKFFFFDVLVVRRGSKSNHQCESRHLILAPFFLLFLDHALE